MPQGFLSVLCELCVQTVLKTALAARLQAKHASFEVDADPVSTQELVADGPAELESEQGARRRQIQHDHRKALVPNRVEGQIDARQQKKRVSIPARRAVHLQ